MEWPEGKPELIKPCAPSQKSPLPLPSRDRARSVALLMITSRKVASLSVSKHSSR